MGFAHVSPISPPPARSTHAPSLRVSYRAQISSSFPPPRLPPSLSNTDSKHLTALVKCIIHFGRDVVFPSLSLGLHSAEGLVRSVAPCKIYATPTNKKNSNTDTYKHEDKSTNANINSTHPFPSVLPHPTARSDWGKISHDEKQKVNDEDEERIRTAMIEERVLVFCVNVLFFGPNPLPPTPSPRG